MVGVNEVQDRWEDPGSRLLLEVNNDADRPVVKVLNRLYYGEDRHGRKVEPDVHDYQRELVNTLIDTCFAGIAYDKVDLFLDSNSNATMSGLFGELVNGHVLPHGTTRDQFFDALKQIPVTEQTTIKSLATPKTRQKNILGIVNALRSSGLLANHQTVLADEALNQPYHNEEAGIHYPAAPYTDEHGVAHPGGYLAAYAEFKERFDQYNEISRMKYYDTEDDTPRPERPMPPPNPRVVEFNRRYNDVYIIRDPGPKAWGRLLEKLIEQNPAARETLSEGKSPDITFIHDVMRATVIARSPFYADALKDSLEYDCQGDRCSLRHMNVKPYSARATGYADEQLLIGASATYNNVTFPFVSEVKLLDPGMQWAQDLIECVYDVMRMRQTDSGDLRFENISHGSLAPFFKKYDAVISHLMREPALQSMMATIAAERGPLLLGGVPDFRGTENPNEHYEKAMVTCYDNLMEVHRRACVHSQTHTLPIDWLPEKTHKCDSGWNKKYQEAIAKRQKKLISEDVPGTPPFSHAMMEEVRGTKCKKTAKAPKSASATVAQNGHGAGHSNGEISFSERLVSQARRNASTPDTPDRAP